MARQDDDDFDDPIEIIEEVMSNEMFLAALAVGVVAGAILLYLYMQARQNGGISLQLGNRPEALPDVEPEYLDAPEQQ